MNINLSISQAPGITTNYLVSAIYEANPDGSIGPLAAYQAFAAPHTAPRNISYTNVDSIVYVHVLWENTTNAPGGTLRNRFIYDPSYNNSTIELRLDLFLTVGAGTGNPVSGETSFLREDLKDWVYSIEKRGVGILEQGVEVAINPIGGFTLLQDGDAFYTGDKWVLDFEPRIVTNNPIEPQIPGRLFSSTQIITSNTTLIASDIGKSKLIQAAADNITVILMPLSLIGANRMIGFISDGGSHKNATIKTDGTDRILFMGQLVDKVILGQNEMIYLYKSVDGGGNNIWVVSMCKGSFSEVGQLVMSFNLTEANTVIAGGQILDRLVYPRLWRYVQSLSSDMLVSDSNWTNDALNNKGRFSSGNGTTTFRVPNLSIPGFIRGVNGVERLSGSFQSQDVQPHNHPAKRTRTDTVGSQYEGNSIRQGGDRGLYTGDDITTGNSTGTETRPSNTGIYFLIKI